MGLLSLTWPSPSCHPEPGFEWTEGGRVLSPASFPQLTLLPAWEGSGWSWPRTAVPWSKAPNKGPGAPHSVLHREMRLDWTSKLHAGLGFTCLRGVRVQRPQLGLSSVTYGVPRASVACSPGGVHMTLGARAAWASSLLPSHYSGHLREGVVKVHLSWGSHIGHVLTRLLQ